MEIRTRSLHTSLQSPGEFYELFYGEFMDFQCSIHMVFLVSIVGGKVPEFYMKINAVISDPKINSNIAWSLAVTS